jgi:hypothetical protein
VLLGDHAAADAAVVGAQAAEEQRLMSDWDVIIWELIGEMVLTPVADHNKEGADEESHAYYYDDQQACHVITDTGFSSIMLSVDDMEIVKQATNAPTVLGAIPNEVVQLVKQQLRELGLVDGGYGAPGEGASDGEAGGDGWCSDTPSL